MTSSYALLCSDRWDSEASARPIAAELLGEPEAEFAARLRAGDQAAFEALYRAFYPRLITFAAAYVDASIAEEVVQDVLLAVWDRRAAWRVDQGIAAYLYASVRNRALKHVRHEGVIARLAQSTAASGDVPGTGEAVETSDAIAERDELRRVLAAALAQFPEQRRMAFVLRWVHQLSYDEVAAAMGISPDAARKHVSRAREALVPVLRPFVSR